ncbi:MAG: hypothetical protein AAGH60_12405 [Pseudomonadota bacterium]
MEPAESNVVPMASRAGRLADALKRARTRMQTQAERVAAHRSSRLAALEYEVQSLALELNSANTGLEDRFSLARSHAGDKLVIDALAYADLHPERDVYRLVRQMRDGPAVLIETPDTEEIAGAIADYVAERIVEVEKPLMSAADVAAQPTSPVRSNAGAPAIRSLGFWINVALFLFGAITAALALFAFAWLSYPGGG